MWPARRYGRSETSLGGPVAVLVLVLAAVLLQQMILVTGAVFVLSLYLIARIWSGYTIRHLEVVRRYPDRVFVGEEVTVEVRIRNNTLLPIPWLRVCESIPVSLGAAGPSISVIQLAGRQEHVVQYTLCPLQRGVRTPGTLSLDTGDLLGTQNYSLFVPASEQIVVFPRIVPLERLGLPATSPVPVVPSARSFVDDTSHMVGVRDYRQGDPVSRMHWAAAAGTGQLLVKQFQPAGERFTLLCLDLDPLQYPYDHWTAREQAIVVAASLAYHIILREGQPVGLVTQGVDRMDPDTETSFLPSATPEHLLSMLDRLARIQPTHSGGLPQLLRTAATRLPWGASVILITGQADEELLTVLLESRRRGHAVSVLRVQPPRSRDMEAPVVGIPVRTVWTDAELGALQ